MTAPCCMSAAHGQRCGCRRDFNDALTGIEISCKESIYVTVSHDGAEMFIRQSDHNAPDNPMDEIWLRPNAARQLAIALLTMADALENES